MVDVKKYDNAIKSLIDELEMMNYLKLIEKAHEAGLISDDEYKSKILTYLKTYETEQK